MVEVDKLVKQYDDFCLELSLEIPDGITEIAPYAFRYNYILEKLKMPLNLRCDWKEWCWKKYPD